MFNQTLCKIDNDLVNVRVFNSKHLNALFVLDFKVNAPNRQHKLDLILEAGHHPSSAIAGQFLGGRLVAVSSVFLMQSVGDAFHPHHAVDQGKALVGNLGLGGRREVRLGHRLDINDWESDFRGHRQFTCQQLFQNLT